MKYSLQNIKSPFNEKWKDNIIQQTVWIVLTYNDKKMKYYGS